MEMAREEIEIGNEISTDLKDTYDELVSAKKLLSDIYHELRLLRVLAEMSSLKSEEMKRQYEDKKREINHTKLSRQRHHLAWFLT
jgi:hypothetical protein